MPDADAEGRERAELPSIVTVDVLCCRRLIYALGIAWSLMPPGIELSGAVVLTVFLQSVPKHISRHSLCHGSGR